MSNEMVAVKEEQDTVIQIGDSLVTALEPPDADQSTDVPGAVKDTVEGGAKTEVPAAKVEEPIAKAEVPDLSEELSDLRALARSQAKELALLRSKVDRHEAVQKGGIGDKEPDPSELELLREQIAEIGQTRGNFFDELLETMELNPKYEDVKSVCTQKNIDYIIDVAATNLSAKTGEDITLVTLRMEKEFWMQRNPYKYGYELIKGYHPKYRVAEVKEIPGTEGKKAAEAPGSIAEMGGDSDKKGGGWTSAKIDALDESELSQVPTDIYDKYLMGKLP